MGKHRGPRKLRQWKPVIYAVAGLITKIKHDLWPKRAKWCVSVGGVLGKARLSGSKKRKCMERQTKGLLPHKEVFRVVGYYLWIIGMRVARQMSWQVANDSPEMRWPQVNGSETNCRQINQANTQTKEKEKNSGPSSSLWLISKAILAGVCSKCSEAPVFAFLAFSLCGLLAYWMLLIWP